MERLSSSKPDRTWCLIESPRAAALLADPDALRFFVPFLARTCTASDAARRAASRLDTMLYRIETFLGAGLIEVIPGPTPSSRKRYRSVADRFLIPFELTQFETLVQLFLRHDAPQQRQFAEALVGAVGDRDGWMLRVHRDDGHGYSAVTVDAAPAGQPDWDMTQMLAPEAPATWYTGQGLYLDDATAKELQRDLLALWQKYDACRATQVEGTLVKHWLQLQLAPLRGPES